MKINVEIELDDKQVKEGYDNIEELILRKFGYHKVPIETRLTPENKKIFREEISDAIKNGTTFDLEKRVNMQYYWEKNDPRFSLFNEQ